MAVLRIDGLPPEPLDAAAMFHADWLPRAIALADGGADSLVLIFPAADHTHREWRLAAVQGLARRFAPLRVNALACDDCEPIEAALRYLAAAPGVTGQYLPLDGTGAGEVICTLQ
ncbi:Rossmann fold domain-containing protein [Novosphingobium aquimarinum]|uniref:Rossmann fold domain-containing protein n=1 Tax=Novosphingobium aquimarinum TaxID=2682494 RepID=UPI0012EC4646|nr:hypothetical protein [Novosphingobium aquimarinum]